MKFEAPYVRFLLLQNLTGAVSGQPMICAFLNLRDIRQQVAPSSAFDSNFSFLIYLVAVFELHSMDNPLLQQKFCPCTNVKKLSYA